jgi:chromosome segregation ATPase
MSTSGNGGHKPCKGKASCGFLWSWATRERCFRCSRVFDGLPRAVSPPPPSGAWARGWPKHSKEKWTDNTKTDKKESKDELGDLSMAVEFLKKAGAGDLAGAASDMLEAAKSAKLNGKPVWQQFQRLEQNLAKKQRAAETATKKLEGTREAIEKLQAEAKETEVNLAGLEIEIEALTKEISLAPKTDQKSKEDFTVYGADLVPAHCKEGEEWKEAQASYEEACKRMHGLVLKHKPDPEERPAPPTPFAATPVSSQASEQARAEIDEAEDVDMDEMDDEDKALVDGLFADAALASLSDELRKELKRKGNEMFDGMLRAKKHNLKSRRARTTVG